MSLLVGKIEILNTKLETIIGLLSSVGEKKQEPIKKKAKKSKGPAVKPTKSLKSAKKKTKAKK
ncbi:hypothetical protein MUP65_02635 [Patescibacteria group bacterium]|nr:hypothetical protein [Patescibacteria group bacterium]